MKHIFVYIKIHIIAKVVFIYILIAIYKYKD